MIQEVEKYAKMVGNLEIPKSVLEQALGIFQAVPERDREGFPHTDPQLLKAAL